MLGGSKRVWWIRDKILNVKNPLYLKEPRFSCWKTNTELNKWNTLLVSFNDPGLLLKSIFITRSKYRITKKPQTQIPNQQWNHNTGMINTTHADFQSSAVSERLHVFPRKHFLNYKTCCKKWVEREVARSDTTLHFLYFDFWCEEQKIPNDNERYFNRKIRKHTNTLFNLSKPLSIF